MDAEYFIEIILQGRDNLTATLAKASAELKAFKAEAESLGGTTDRLTVSQNRQAGASRNSTQAAERAAIAANKEVAAIKDSVHAKHMLDQETTRLLGSTNRLEKGFGRVRAAALGVQRQFFDLKRGVRDMDYATRQAQGAFFDLAYNASRGFDNMVKSATRMNTVAALLAPLIFSLITAVLNLAAAFVAVASAAAMAAAAIGGALVAGVMQAIPVVGLLVAAVGRLKAILNTATLLQKEHVRSTRDFVGEQRKNARDLVDIQNAKIDAILGEKDANLALLEARDRLRKQELAAADQRRNLGALQGSVDDAKQNLDRAKATGDPMAIASALAQYSSAQQQFNTANTSFQAQNTDLERKRAELTVAEAAQRAKEATITRQRAVEDAARAKKLGYVNKPPAMVGEDAANQALKKLDPTERQVLHIVQEFKKLWAKATRPLTDMILSAIGDALKQFEKLFGDKSFMAAWTGLAKALSTGIRELASFFTSAEQRAFFTNFINLAKDNLPTIVGIFERIFVLVEKIATAFAPVLAGILGGVSGFVGRQNQKAGEPAKAGAGFQQNRLGAFAERSQGFLTQFTAFLGALFHFIGAVIGVSSGPGGTALERMTKALQHWADELNGPKHEGARKFFERSIDLSGQILDFFGKLIGLLFELSQNSGFSTFLKDLETIGIPALKHVGELYAILFKTFAFAASKPIIGPMIEFLTMLIVASKIVPFFGPLLRQIIRGAGRGTAAVLSRVGAGGLGGALSKALNPEVAAIEAQTGILVTTEEQTAAEIVAAIRMSAGLGGFSGRKMGKAEGADYWASKAAREEKLLAGEATIATTRLGRLRTVINRWGRDLPILGGVMTKNLIPATLPLIARLGLGAGLAGVMILGSLAVYKLITKIPILNSAFDALGRGIGNLIYKVGKHIGNLLGLNPDKIHGDQTDTGGYETGFANVYARVKAAHPHWSKGRLLAETQRQLGATGTGHFEAGGEVGGGGAGTAVPITAHVGEWVLNSSQQHAVAQALGMPVGLIKDYLFGKSKGETMAEHARKRKRAGKLLAQAPGLKTGFDSDRMGSWYGFSPDIDDWGGTEFGVPEGGGTDAAQKAKRDQSPLFIETPLGQYVNLARNDLARIIKGKGFWIPEYVKRAQGYAGATRGQIQGWKRGHVMRGLGVHEGEGGQAAVAAILRSKLWSYGSGGVVGFQPSTVSRPSFAAGGVVARGATPAPRPATRSTNQEFNIITASPKVDIDYVMRVAKIHSESGS